jgi:TonB family protein
MLRKQKLFGYMLAVIRTSFWLLLHWPAENCLPSLSNIAGKQNQHFRNPTSENLCKKQKVAQMHRCQTIGYTQGVKVTQFSVFQRQLHKALQHLMLGAVLVWSLFSLSAETVKLEDGSQLELKGIGLAQEFKTDIYIGALYAPVGYESLELIKDYTTPKRILVRYVADNYSYRKVSRHFKERIAMNMAREEWQPLTREIVTFSNIFKQNFQAGDEIRMDFIPGKGTSIYLNGVLFETISNPEFINLIINSWTGSVPPTKAFKEGITGALDEGEKQKILARFNALTPVKGRFKLPENETLVAEAKEPAKPKTETTQAQKQVNPKAESKVVEQKATISKPKVETPPKAVVSANPQPKKTEPKQVVEAKPKQESVVKQSDTTSEESEKSVARQEKPKSKPAPVEEDFIDEDLIRGSYVRELIAQVRKNETYPRKALINQEEGDGVARVVINREGNLVDVALSERTGSRELDKGILTMIRRTNFAPIPKELKEQEFEFEIPFSFKLNQ